MSWLLFDSMSGSSSSASSIEVFSCDVAEVDVLADAFAAREAHQLSHGPPAIAPPPMQLFDDIETDPLVDIEEGP